MTKTLFSTLLLLGVTAGLTSATAAAQNLTINGDFETGDLSSWDSFPTANSTFTITGDSNSGAFAGRVFNDDVGSAAVIKQSFLGAGVVSGGATVTISFAAKGEGMVGGVAFAELFTEVAGGGVSAAELLSGAPLSLTNSWQNFSFTTTAGNNATGGLTLQFATVTGAAMGSQMELFVDDVEVTAVSNVIELTPFTEDFEGLNAADGGALAAADWVAAASVFDTMGNFAYFYGVFGAPNGAGGFSNVATGEGGPDQGAQQLVTFSDYNNGDHGNSFEIESNVFREQTVGASDVGKTFTFQFDAKMGDLAAPSTALAFIKIIDSGNFGIDGISTFDTTNIPSSWDTYSVSITIEPQHVGDFFQTGFQTNATNFNPSGVFYDNCVFGEAAPVIELTPFTEDFEGLDAMDAGALTAAEWVVGASVFDPMGAFLYFYGVFGAPNGAGGFSNVAAGQGGPDQGAQQLVTFSDYNNGDHGIGREIESNVFREQTVGATDVGKTFTFQFDAKMGDLAAPSTALGFIKIIDSGNFGIDGIATVDMTSIPTTWGTYSVSITIEPQHVGDFFQTGFQTNATNFNPSGVFYDNVVFGEAVSLGTNYCQAVANSTGSAGVMSATGSDVAADNNFTLAASQLPANEFGIFVVGSASRPAAQLPASNGALCLDGQIGRFTMPSQVLDSGAAGSFSLQIDLSAIPQGLGFVPTMGGQTWFFQAWFRDTGTGLGSNLTDGLEVIFQ